MVVCVCVCILKDSQLSDFQGQVIKLVQKSTGKSWIMHDK